MRSGSLSPLGASNHQVKVLTDEDGVPINVATEDAIVSERRKYTVIEFEGDGGGGELVDGDTDASDADDYSEPQDALLPPELPPPNTPVAASGQLIYSSLEETTTEGNVDKGKENVTGTNSALSDMYASTKDIKIRKSLKQNKTMSDKPDYDNMEANLNSPVTAVTKDPAYASADEVQNLTHTQKTSRSVYNEAVTILPAAWGYTTAEDMKNQPEPVYAESVPVVSVKSAQVGRTGTLDNIETTGRYAEARSAPDGENIYNFPASAAEVQVGAVTAGKRTQSQDTFSITLEKAENEKFGVHFIGASNVNCAKEDGVGIFISGTIPSSAVSNMSPHMLDKTGWQVMRLNDELTVDETLAGLESILISAAKKSRMHLEIVQNMNGYAKFVNSQSPQVALPAENCNTDETTIVLTRGTAETFGTNFSIGPNKDIILSSVVPGSPASLAIADRIGQAILAVNGRDNIDSMHTLRDAVNMDKDSLRLTFGIALETAVPNDNIEGKTDAVVSDHMPASDVSSMQAYMHGPISREAAGKICVDASKEKATGDGTYLVRESDTEVGAHHLCVVFKGKATHHKISVDADGIYLINNKNFDDPKTIDQLIVALSQPQNGWPVPLTSPIADPTMKSHANIDPNEAQVGEPKVDSTTDEASRPSKADDGVEVKSVKPSLETAPLESDKPHTNAISVTIPRGVNGFGIKFAPMRSGVRVDSVIPDSPGAAILAESIPDLQAGYRVARVNDVPIKSLKDIAVLLRSNPQTMFLQLERLGHERRATMPTRLKTDLDHNTSPENARGTSLPKRPPIPLPQSDDEETKVDLHARKMQMLALAAKMDDEESKQTQSNGTAASESDGDFSVRWAGSCRLTRDIDYSADQIMSHPRPAYKSEERPKLRFCNGIVTIEAANSDVLAKFSASNLLAAGKYKCDDAAVVLLVQPDSERPHYEVFVLICSPKYEAESIRFHIGSCFLSEIPNIEERVQLAIASVASPSVNVNNTTVQSTSGLSSLEEVQVEQPESTMSSRKYDVVFIGHGVLDGGSAKHSELDRLLSKIQAQNNQDTKPAACILEADLMQVISKNSGRRLKALTPESVSGSESLQNSSVLAVGQYVDQISKWTFLRFDSPEQCITVRDELRRWQADTTARDTQYLKQSGVSQHRHKKRGSIVQGKTIPGQVFEVRHLAVTPLPSAMTNLDEERDAAITALQLSKPVPEISLLYLRVSLTSISFIRDDAVDRRLLASSVKWAVVLGDTPPAFGSFLASTYSGEAGAVVVFGYEDPFSGSRNAEFLACPKSMADQLTRQLTVCAEAKASELATALTPLTTVSDSVDPQFAHCTMDRTAVQVIRELGHGNFGKVYLAESVPNMADTSSNSGTSRKCAVKTLQDGSGGTEHRWELRKAAFLKEAEITKQMNHPNLVRLMGVSFEHRPWFMAVEFMPFGDTERILRQYAAKEDILRPSEQLYLCYQIAAGLEHVVSCRVSHLDIAARNVLLGTRMTAKLADFGNAQRWTEGRNSWRLNITMEISQRWMAPEAFKSKIFSENTDVWSYGVFCWEVMSYGKLPYHGIPTDEIGQHLARGGLLTAPADALPSLCKILEQCFHRKATERPSFSDLRSELQSQLKDNPSPRIVREIGASTQTEAASAMPEFDLADIETNEWLR